MVRYEYKVIDLSFNFVVVIIYRVWSFGKIVFKISWFLFLFLKMGLKVVIIVGKMKVSVYGNVLIIVIIFLVGDCFECFCFCR